MKAKKGRRGEKEMEGKRMKKLCKRKEEELLVSIYVCLQK